MRGNDQQQNHIFGYLSPGQRVRKDHPLQAIRAMVDEDLGGARRVVGWAYRVSVIDCCTREIVGWNLSHRCWTEDALAAVEQAVLTRLPEGPGTTPGPP